MTKNTTIIDRLEHNARRQGARPAIHDKVMGTWRTRNWREYNLATRRFAKGLMSAGLGEGDPVAILGANRPEWTISALAAIRIGGIAAGIYTTSSAEEIGYIVGHSEATVIVVENHEQIDRLLEVWDTVPKLKTAVLMEGAGEHPDPRVIGWDEVIAAGAGITDEELDARQSALRPDQVADEVDVREQFFDILGRNVLATGRDDDVLLTADNR